MLGVDAGLAADRGIDLRQERGRHLDEVHAAPHDACRETGEVADHAAAERNDRVAAFEPRGKHAVHDVLKCRETLGLLAGRQCDGDIADAGRVEAGSQCRKMRGGDVLVGDHSHANAGQARRDLVAGTLDQAVADQDVVGALAEPDIDGGQLGCRHAAAPSIAASRSASASITSSAITSLRSSRVGTVTSAVA